ncbi:MAG: 16S rRNA (adenine(1518)-N(6)/adenine(1519)-N(6))-dimethyltransferase RsmA [Myxococcota bacterium]|nr:ribosomal RNA small subunit methyltransferase A [bacterium]MDP6075993.1 16S rRNA (adenine(1518)-N(6)/adenine(1519)-N(6))-dimethyltransferase RsmA [Myxococcota bacterium]MDP6243373.1 16S rRNA (adenine(1518)-N(6)/adenine(1519)-N(6))-dimethyltransferase RsmA [Myxococcota bacterium]MDP7076356.1 16S rRNA (adenine(1518)-N(6)/adenine(1519)-N(6))-dimethyltransferase RsmA [Myxococcota bacterium]MDP7299972.1 16S rRNA (adenine(1518)-N(6)/adenine(1519)-N(6))-dimethyltransferase RsmA [Myxococcota bacteri
MSAAEVRRFLERHGLRANRDLGQNFLCDPELAGRLVELAGVTVDDTVLEIGAGLGILTRALAARAARVVALEVDSGIVAALRAEGALPANVELRHADALTEDLAGLASVRGPVRLVANLPYAVSAPLLRRLLDLRGLLVDWSVMLQREVAARLMARPGSRDYGSLAVLHRFTTDVSQELRVSPGRFFPRPKVQSSFLRIRPLPEPWIAPGELAAVERVVRAAFGQRRKQLANALRGSQLWTGESVALALRAAGVDVRARAESLDARTLLEIARSLPPVPQTVP